MLPPRIATLLDHISRQIASNQPERSEHQRRIPVEYYFASAQYEAEKSTLFSRYPLIVAHSSDLKSGTAMAHDAYGVPLLLTRDADGVVHCFLNVCRHRGMRLFDDQTATARQGVACPYHGWSYHLDGKFRHMLKADAFDACPTGERDLVAVPCAERAGLIWVIPSPNSTMNLDEYLGDLPAELDYYDVAEHVTYRVVENHYAANWKLIVDAFLEAYHIRVLHRDTIHPFFMDGINSGGQMPRSGTNEAQGPHFSSMVARRPAQEWQGQGSLSPKNHHELRELVTPSHVIFPNTIAIYHPDYVSLISLFPTGAESLRWVHRMLIPKEKATPEWQPHWEKTFELIEKGVFQKEDIHTAVGIQQGLRTGANTYLTVGRVEAPLADFHREVQAAISLAL